MKSNTWFWVVGAACLVAVGCSNDVESSGDGGGGSGASGTGTSTGTTSSSGTGGGVDCGCVQGAYYPVCGVDGQTYDATCGIECVPVAVACQGECPCGCDDLEASYAEQLALAKECSPELDVEQCTTLVDDQLGCPCETMANPSNGEAMAQLPVLQAEWNALGCGDLIDCPEIACEIPAAGSCEGTVGSGSCTDQFSNQ